MSAFQPSADHLTLSEVCSPLSSLELAGTLDSTLWCLPATDGAVLVSLTPTGVRVQCHDLDDVNAQLLLSRLTGEVPGLNLSGEDLGMAIMWGEVVGAPAQPFAAFTPGTWAQLRSLMPERSCAELSAWMGQWLTARGWQHGSGGAYDLPGERPVLSDTGA